MKLNKKYVILGIILLIAAWGGNIYYYQKHILKEPVFTKHYYDITPGRESFQLNYIDNINSQSKIAGIVFPEIGPEFVSYEERDYNGDERYYRLKLISIKLPEDPKMIKEKYENKPITKAEIHLSDGRIMKVDIGKIYISSDEEITGRELFEHVSSMGSSDNTGNAIFTAKSDFKIDSISSKFPELMGDVLEISVNDKPFKEMSFPMELKKGDTLKIGYGFKFNDGDIRSSYAYDFPINVVMEDNEGRKGSILSFANYWLQFPGWYDIKALAGREK